MVRPDFQLSSILPNQTLTARDAENAENAQRVETASVLNSTAGPPWPPFFYAHATLNFLDVEPSRSLPKCAEPVTNYARYHVFPHSKHLLENPCES